MNHQRRFWLIMLMLTLPSLLGALAMDMLLPALPDMAVSLQLTAGQIQWMLNIFILGFAFCQLLVGLGATRFSDHQLFLLAIVLFILSSAAIAFMTSYTGILVLRFMQALASCTTLVISMSLITQSFSASQVTKGHSILSGITSLGPLLAPLVGVAILNTGANWRGIFFMLALTGCLILILFFRVNPLFYWRTQPAPRQYYGKIARSPQFWRYAIFSSAGMSWIFLFFSTSPFIVHTVYLQDKWALALLFSIASGCFMIGSYMGAVSRQKEPSGLLLEYCLIAQIALSAFLATLTFFYELPFYGFVTWIMMMQVNCGLYFGPAISAALQTFPDIPVQAAAFQGFQQFSITFLIAGLLLFFFRHEIYDLSVMVLIVSFLAISAVSIVKIKYGV